MINKIWLKIAFPIILAALILLALAALFISPHAQAAISNAVDFNLVAIAGLGISAALCGVGVWSAFFNMNRLQRVIRAADNLAKGDFSTEFSLHSSDEIGQLQAALQETVHYLRETAAVADQIAAGNLNTRVTIRSATDRFNLALSNMLDNIGRFVQSKDERDHLQFSIVKLLDEVSGVADGDLTAQAEVTSDATGAIADAFNHMIAELRAIIHQVQSATDQVGMSAVEIRATTERLADGSETQAAQIAATSQAIEEISASIRAVSETATRSTDVAHKSLSNAQYGARAVENNIQAMGRIRNQVQETAKRIKRLGERSQEIGEIVRLIDDLADRTSILALNASLQAAAAGEQGRGFATVAEEVERLADRSAEAVSQIAGLTKSIQTETREAVSAMEETIREVVEGSQLATEAGAALQEIERVSNSLAEMIDSISQTAYKQAGSSAEIANTMANISSVTELVAAESKQASSAVRGLIGQTERLRGSVSTFKLPVSENGKAKYAPQQLNGAGGIAQTEAALVQLIN
jgi:twitching motility protein PilJ